MNFTGDSGRLQKLRVNEVENVVIINQENIFHFDLKRPKCLMRVKKFDTMQAGCAKISHLWQKYKLASATDPVDLTSNTRLIGMQSQNHRIAMVLRTIKSLVSKYEVIFWISRLRKHPLKKAIVNPVKYSSTHFVINRYSIDDTLWRSVTIGPFFSWCPGWSRLYPCHSSYERR